MINYEDPHKPEPISAAPDVEIKKPEEQKPKHTKIKFFIFVVFSALVSVSFIASAPSNFTKGGIVTISSGESLGEISSNLQRDGYIKSSLVFSNTIVLIGGERYLSPGDYYFEKPVSVFELAFQIGRGRHNLEPIKITVPEGKTNDEISDIFSSKLSAFDSKIFKKNADQYEGFLFPETYFVYPRTDALSVLSEMKNMYTKEAKPVIKKDNKFHKSERDIVIMASMIEKEARGSDDRAVISGILWNRLDRQIPLQVDATVAYARHIPEGSLQKSDMGFDSPYNTYIYRGLPPGPISNPGILALEAAMNPAETEYLYYLHDKHGNIHYAKTYIEHQENINNYLR